MFLIVGGTAGGMDPVAKRGSGYGPQLLRLGKLQNSWLGFDHCTGLGLGAL